MLNRIRDDLGDSIIIEQFPKLEGRQMIMMIAPGKKWRSLDGQVEVARWSPDGQVAGGGR